MSEVKNVVITPEYLEKIRKFTAIQPDETFIYVPVAYRDLPDEIKPKFTLHPITGEEGLRFADSMRGQVIVDNGKAQVSVKHGEYTISVVKRGLVGWENYYTSTGKIIEYRKDSIENLPRALLEELSDAISEHASLTDEEVLGLK